jgi:hypothetical protein
VKRCLAKNRPVDDEQCPREATLALKLEFFAIIDSTPAVAFINIKTCDDHKMPDEEVKQFLTMNWHVLCQGFNLVGKQEPDFSLTRWSWAPLAEAEKFWEEGESDAKKVYKN